jgi:UTP--glucose-1-phosphate uridylyltransferase
MIRKAVIPAAGSGTRFLPATKAQPKEMLPIIDTPTIQYVVQEAVDSGIEDILIITGKGKRAIEDHFDRSFKLEQILEDTQKTGLRDEMRRIADMANIHFIRQKDLNGLGDAVNHARDHVGKEPFAVLLGDAIIDSDVPATRQLIDCHEKFKCAIIAVETVPEEKLSRYGIIGGKKIGDTIHEVTSLIEKPSVEESPSNLAIAGRYILTPDIFDILDELPRGKDNEIQLTDALRALLATQRVYACTIAGKRYDIGDKLDYLKTQVEYGLMREEFKEAFTAFLKDIIDSRKPPF